MKVLFSPLPPRIIIKFNKMINNLNFPIWYGAYPTIISASASGFILIFSLKQMDIIEAFICSGLGRWNLNKVIELSLS